MRLVLKVRFKVLDQNISSFEIYYVIDQLHYSCPNVSKVTSIN